MTYMNKTVFAPPHGKCLVIEEITLKSGKVRLTVKTARGKVEYVMAATLHDQKMEFLPPVSLSTLINEHRHQRAARLAAIGIEE